MSRKVVLEMPDDAYEQASRSASAKGKTIEEWILTDLLPKQPVYVRDERLRRHFGAGTIEGPIAIDNESIDADLARDYGASHDPEQK